MKRRFTLLALLITVVGCKVEPPKPALVETVAILPYDSEANNVDAPDIMQRLTYLALKDSAYRISDIDETNKKLAEKGIIDGGQLAAADPVKIGKDLGVQALLYGYVESFGYVNLGFYTQRKVTLALKMVDAATGQTLWENTGTMANRQFTLDKNEASRNLTAGLVTKLTEKLFDSPLEEEARLATIRSLGTLPGYSFHAFAVDPKGASAFKRVTRDAIKGAINNRKK